MNHLAAALDSFPPSIFLGKNAVVTGAASGIGRATATLLASLGANLALCDVNAEGLAQVEKACRSAGRKHSENSSVFVQAFTVDCGDRKQILEFAQKVAGLFREKVHILVNNAGVADLSSIADADGSKNGSFEAAYDRQWRVNALGPARLTRALYSCLRNGAGGADGELLGEDAGKTAVVPAWARSTSVVVNVSSSEGSGATLFNTPYVMAKHAVIGFTRALAIELGAQGVRVNCVQPGPINTAINEGFPVKIKQTYARKMVPLQRYGEPEEVASVICAICLPCMSYLHGAMVPVDGGHPPRNALLPGKPWFEPPAGRREGREDVLVASAGSSLRQRRLV